jgi:hypothetical protein
MQDPIIRTTDVFEPIEVMHKAQVGRSSDVDFAPFGSFSLIFQIDIEGRESGGSGGYAYCVIA